MEPLQQTTENAETFPPPPVEKTEPFPPPADGAEGMDFPPVEKMEPPSFPSDVEGGGTIPMIHQTFDPMLKAERKRKRLTLEQKAVICEESLQPDFNRKQAMEKYGIAKQTLCGILKQRDDIFAMLNKTTSGAINPLKVQNVSSTVWEEKLVRWLEIVTTDGVQINAQMLRQKVAEINPGFQPTKLWLDRFKKRYNLPDSIGLMLNDQMAEEDQWFDGLPDIQGSYKADNQKLPLLLPLKTSLNEGPSAANIKQDDSSQQQQVCLGSRSNIYYLEAEILREFEDVKMVSNSGQVFKFNRCVLAAQSPICYRVFQDVCRCCSAPTNIEETLTIVTDFTTEEVQALSDFFLHGKVPLDSPSAESTFQAFGIDLEKLKSNIVGSDQKSAAYENFCHNRKSDLRNDLRKQANNVQQEDDPWGPVWIKSEDIDTVIDYGDGDVPMDEYLDEKGTLLNNRSDLARLKKQPSSKAKNVVKKEPKVTVKKSKKKSKVKKEIGQNANLKETYFYFPQTGERDLSLPFQCHRCIRGFKDVFSYRQHFHRHDLETPDYAKAFVCIRCDYFTGSSNTMLVEHGKKSCAVERHDDENSRFSYYCLRCEPMRKYNTSFQLSQHIVEMHEVSRRVCPICGASLTESSYNGHMKTMHGDQNIKCSECPATFKHQHIYTKHFRNKHTIMTCEECGKQFHLTAYRYHVQKYHTPLSKMKFQCKFCNKGFICKQKYFNHLNIHTGEKPHVCKFCPKNFTDLSNCKKHMREAHNEQYLLSKTK